MLERMQSKRNIPPLLVGVQNCTGTLEINMVVSQKWGINLSQDPAIPFLDMYPKDADPFHKDIFSTMFIRALFILTRIWKQLYCLSTPDKENVVHLHKRLLLSSKYQ